MARLTESIFTSDQMVALPFQATDITDAAGTAATLQATTLEYIAPWGGSVVGIGVVHNADLTGGVLTFNPTINGTADTSLAAVTEDTVQRDTGTCEWGAVPFTAGQRLGVKWTKTGTVAPETTDVSIVLYVVFENIVI